ncbi:DUF6232 family protein [Streptomyces sp. NPDC057854]|uniref:DUF6232 family protein n=1 Tax=unclassified Streptomyces TaxID=2593676 RepID=UPI0036AD0EC0
MDTTNGPGTPPGPGDAPGPPPADPPTRRPWLAHGGPAKPRGPRSVDLRVREGVLWIGGAALPLRHLTSVEVARVKPDALLRWLLVLGLAVIGISSVQGGAVPGLGFPLLVAVLAGAAFVALKDVFAPARPVLVVQTAAGSTAVVTLPDLDELRHLAGLVVRAIGDPSAEFHAVVQRMGPQGNGDRQAPVVRMKGGRGGSPLTYR